MIIKNHVKAILILFSIAFFLCTVNTSFGAITFTYDESDNKVVVTEGTSGTPADFDDFVTADRAGTAELTPEDAPVAINNDPTSFSLTYQPRPVEDLAVQLTITASADKVGATIDIDGDDWKGAHQDDDAIDISGAHTTPVVTTTYWSAIDANGITVDGIDDGTTIKITQGSWGVIWDKGNGQYRVDADLDIGGGVSTYFRSTAEDVVFPAHTPHVVADATLQIGVTSNTDYSGKGSTWTVVGGGWTRRFSDGGTVLIYGSTIRFSGGDISLINTATTVWDSIITADSARSWQNYGGALSYRNVYFQDILVWDVYGGATFTLLEDVWVEKCQVGYSTHEASTVKYMKITNYSRNSWQLNAVVTVNALDAISAIGTPWICNDGAILNNCYTCNISVADKDGTLIDDVTVLCEDRFDTEIFSELTGATTTGLIDEQNINYKVWTYNGNCWTTTCTTYSPHKFTLSKAGYQTLVLDNVTVDGPINWHLELQAIKMPPAPFFGDLKADDYYYAEVVNE